ncbi:MAG: hypothetical protein ACOC86_01815 [Candidatus Bipolaricaulota bacterium]
MSKITLNRSPLSIFLVLLFTILISGLPGGQTGTAAEALDSLNSTERGVFSRGELVYVSNGKDLGSEKYELIKDDSGEIVLVSEGVVTPPIPIPFVKPKIKFDQEIRVGADFSPLSLELNYDGPLGIGSDRLKSTVEDGRINADLGEERKEGKVEPVDSYFQGTGGSLAFTALILSKREPKEIVEIRTGGTGPRSGDDERLKAYYQLRDRETEEMEIDGSSKVVDRFVLTDPETGVKKVILADGGTFIAYLRLDEENSFYTHRVDLLGENYEF